MIAVEIGIYTHRWSELQVRAIESIARHTKRHQYSILVTQREGNCHQNMNRLWRRFSAPFAIMMDEDVEVLQDGWLDGLLAALESDAEVGVMGCTAIWQRVLGLPDPGLPELSYEPWIPAHVMAFKRDRVPFLHFDEAIPGQMGMTEVDACLQLARRGLRAAKNGNVVVYHPARDDDETRRVEQRPLVSQQKEWFPDQVRYMREKWGAHFERTVLGAG